MFKNNFRIWNIPPEYSIFNGNKFQWVFVLFAEGIKFACKLYNENTQKKDEKKNLFSDFVNVAYDDGVFPFDFSMMIMIRSMAIY